jgi:hypothetical protein
VNYFKKEEDFELFSDNMISLIIIGVYILINNGNNINNLCQSEKKALLGFLEIKKMKSIYTDEENKVIDLNKIIFLKDNTKEIIIELTKKI